MATNDESYSTGPRVKSISWWRNEQAREDSLNERLGEIWGSGTGRHPDTNIPDWITANQPCDLDGVSNRLRIVLGRDDGYLYYIEVDRSVGTDNNGSSSFAPSIRVN